MRLLITGAWQDAGTYMDRIREMGHEALFLQQEKELLPCGEAWPEGVICNGLFLHHPIEKFENLRYVQLTSAGYDRMDMEYAAEHRIAVYNARGVYSVPMAEYAVGGVLQLYKQFPYFRENQKRHIWEKHRGLMELSGKNVCIVGCGSVGSECAKRFRAFGCAVTGVDLLPMEHDDFDRIRPVAELDAALSDADIVVLTLPLTEKTRHLMNATRFGVMKPGAVLVNISRGAVVDTPALEAALQAGYLRGAVLDVFEEEPLGENSPLWDFENVIITPHNSFVGDGVRQRLMDVILNNLKKEK